MPFRLPGFIAYNCSKWGLWAEQFDYRVNTGPVPRLWGTFYTDSGGRIAFPRNCPYLPVEFEATPTEQEYRRSRQWLTLARNMAREMKERGLVSTVNLPPEITDVRPWAWEGFRTYVAYTLVLDFPWKLEQASHAVRKQVAKAQRLGYVSEKSDDISALVRCLRGTEVRQGISYRMSEDDLKLALSLIGPEHLRIYLCRAPSGEAVSGRAILLVPGRRAMDWLAGTLPDHLQNGVTQHLIAFALTDLEQCKATGFDFAGANIEKVAIAKMEFGARLQPFYKIDSIRLKSLAIEVFRWLRKS